jgi:hypothetical protein
MDTKQGLIGIGVLGIGGMLLFNSYRKADQERQEKKVLLQTGNNPTVQQAQLLRTAMNPYKPLPMSMDGTDERLVFSTAASITDLPSVQKAYSALYDGAELLGDLRSELSSSDYDRFIKQISNNAKTATIVNKDGSITQNLLQLSKQYALGAGYKVWAMKNVVLRSAPDAAQSMPTKASMILLSAITPMLGAAAISTYLTARGLASNSNIIELCKANQFIGYTTGQSRVDNKNNIPFIEIQYTIKGDYAGSSADLKRKHGQKVRGWVSASTDFTFQTSAFKEALDKGYTLPKYKI